ncbi:hypothetical protein F8M41_005319 [Gigaspora margarita]|uniref:F-box domain-containing protein n=1 Tax=Gigaspora margarita TaxID=4874 RepID=A0A8H4AXI8_GIGMA|nr:hypothetical protein F8M41_005319 [Gigaspora margarita]
MASKILTGDMPELMEKILNNLEYEIYSLYSCTLVNRYWCKMSIPILWQEPFVFNRRPLYISNYFSSLGEYEKNILKECGINEEFSKTIFDYARFLKALDLSRLEFQVEQWIELVLVNSNLLNDINLKYNITIVINNLLFKVLIENGATLHNLDLCFSRVREYKPEIFYVLEQNEQFLSQLQYLSLSAIEFNYIDSATAWLRVVAKYATKIITLNIEDFYPDFDPQIFHALINVIKSQEQLRLFGIAGAEFFTEYHGMISALKSQKNSLQEVIINSCAFNEEFEVLKNCKNLETLRIKNCDQELSKLSKILDPKISNKISTLEVIYCQTDTIILMLEKFGILLQRLRLKLDGDKSLEYTLLLEALKSFCPNIIYLDIRNVKFSTQLVELISDLQKLQFLSLQCYTDGISDEALKKRVIQFSELLPLTLQYLDLDNWLGSYTDILLNHCNVPLKKLLFYKIYNEKISKALIEFCIRNKALKYVGIYYDFYLDDNIRKEVEAYVELVLYGHIIEYC